MPRVLALLLLVAAGGCQSSERALTIFGGQYSQAGLAHDILLLGDPDLDDSYLLAAGLSHAAAPRERHRWEAETQVVRHFGAQDNWELNQLAIVRLLDMPGQEYLRSTAALGEGLSLASNEPRLEDEEKPDTGTTRLLNYLLFELTVAPPRETNWAFVFRIHHRSGIFGLFDGVTGGSNALTVGVRFVL